MKKHLYVAFALVASAVLPVLVPSAAAEVGYNKGFYILSDDKNFKFTMNVRFQPNWSYTFKEAAIDETTFGNSTVRTIFKGHAFSPKYNYYLSLEYSSAAGKPTLKDGFAALELTDPFKIQAGQFYVPINREDEFSAIGGNLVSSSLMGDHFGIGRDIGVQLYGDVLKGPLTYYVFFVNGNGQNAANKDKNFLTGTRLHYTVMGEMGGYQGDINYSENPNIGVGTTVLYDFGSVAETEDFAVFNQQGLTAREDRLIRGDVDGLIYWRGYSLFGQWQYVYNNQFRSFDHGYMAQSGYFIIPKRFEAVGRYSVVFPDFPFPALAQTGLTAAGNDGSGTGGIPIHEATGGLSYYFQGHLMKVQAEYSQVYNRGGFRNLNDQTVRAQLTLTF